MSSLRDKKILLGVTGSIAAYKTALLTRLLVKAGAEVKVVMTPASTEFIPPLTLSTLSKNPVLYQFVKNQSGEWNNHVELGLWADMMIIAPLSASTLSKMVSGQCDNLLIATYLSARCPVLVAPAMDLDMYAHPSTLRNLDQLQKDGVGVIDAENGELASGLSGTGRMAEPEHILKHIQQHGSSNSRLAGKTAIVTAGPTVEPIDPVRYISNHSSGKMGYSIADALAKEGCDVYLITGPTNITPPHVKEVIEVQTAVEMLEASENLFLKADIAVLSAAVADYRSSNQSEEKIKKDGNTLELSLIKNPDIAAHLGKIKTENQFIVGFALETQNEEENALKKLTSKNFDIIVLNSLNHKGAGFGHNTNRVTLYGRDNKKLEIELKEKKEVAIDIVNEIIRNIS